MSTHTPHPDLSPPITNVGVIGWLRTNLFSSWPNAILTVAAAFVIFATLPPLIEWAFIKADWVGDSRDACTSGGACWVFVGVRFNQFMYGLYPEAEYWRINLAAVLIVVLMVPLFIGRFRWKLQLGLFNLVGYPIIVFFLFSGGVFGLEYVETSRWGGLTLTLVLASVGMAASFPLGVLLALGRRSTMPIVKSVSVVFIEFWRGVPLITVLFMSSVMLPLFLPEGTHFDKLLRAMIGISLFQSAYMAEVVRGGLQAIPKGQYEAAQALGLSFWKSMGTDHHAAGAEAGNPRHRQHLHRLVQRHDTGPDHRTVRHVGDDRGRAGRSELVGLFRRRADFRRFRLLGFLFQHVALQHGPGEKASYRPLPLTD